MGRRVELVGVGVAVRAVRAGVGVVAAAVLVGWGGVSATFVAVDDNVFAVALAVGAFAGAKDLDAFVVVAFSRGWGGGRWGS